MIAAADGVPPSGLPKEFRYSRKAKARDVLVAVALMGTPGALLFVFLGERLAEDPTVWRFLACWALLTIPAVVVLGLWRWRAWGRADEAGLWVSSRGDGAGQALPWDGIEEVRWLGEGGFEVRGDGRTLRIANEMEDAFELRQETMRRVWKRLLTGMREELAAGRSVVFPGRASGPELLWHVLLPQAFLATFAVSMVSTAVRQAGEGRVELGVGIMVGLIGLCGLAWIARSTWVSWGWKRGAVELSSEALVLRGLGPARRIALEEILKVLEAPQGRVFRLRNGRSLGIPSDLPNGPFLEHLIRDRLKC